MANGVLIEYKIEYRSTGAVRLWSSVKGYRFATTQRWNQITYKRCDATNIGKGNIGFFYLLKG